MDWVHCNACFFQPCDLPKRDFKLTSCGHIFCQCCERSGTLGQCKMCGVKCTTTPLSSEMAKEVMTYFEDPDVTVEKAVKVMEFQKSHRQKLCEHYKNMTKKYNMLKLNYQKIEEENKAMKNELEEYKRRLTVTVTPPQHKPQYNHPLFSKNSQASKIIQMGMNQSRSKNGCANSQSPFFITPSRTPSQQYRIPNVTPMSNASSPGSVSSRHSYGGSQRSVAGSMSSQQRMNHPGYTPPLNRLSMLSVNSQNPRNPTRY